MIKDFSTINEVFVKCYDLTQNQCSSSKSHQYKPLVFCGPSGSGKTTLIKQIMNKFDGCFDFSISHTSRKPREGEVDGQDYHFIDYDSMKKSIQLGNFLESTEFSGNLYGTSKKSIIDVQNNRKICILDIDIEGVRSLKRNDLDANYIFVKPPSTSILENRLRTRGTENEESIKKRLDRANVEFNLDNLKGFWNYIIINDSLNDAYNQLKQILKELYSL